MTVMCSALNVSRSGFYASERRGMSRRARENARLVEQIRAVHVRSRATYGSPRIHAELGANKIAAGRHRIARLMREEGIVARRPRRFRKTTLSNHGLPVAENVLAREFTTASPNEAWVGDITYIWTRQGWAYLAVVLDLFSRRVVGWALREHLRTELATEALNHALRRRVLRPGLIHHSDRGCQYASKAYQDVLANHGMVASMSRKGDCWDNAVAESFFATLRGELTERCEWATHPQARAAIHEFIEVFYNRQRRHSHLGYLSPAQFETLAAANIGVAA